MQRGERKKSEVKVYLRGVGKPLNVETINGWRDTPVCVESVGLSLKSGEDSYCSNVVYHCISFYNVGFFFFVNG